MPRGVYDRNKNAQGTQAAEGKTAKAKGPKGKTKTAAPATRSNIVAHPTANVKEQFEILTSNITTLANVRATLSGNDAVAKRTEAEIIQHVVAIRDLRQKTFGLTSDEQAEQEAKKTAEATTTTVSVPGNGGVPLPVTKPSPVPPTPIQS